MRDQPTLRIPFGIIAPVVGLTAYALVIARYVPELLAGTPTWAQTVVYLLLGLAWLLPLKRFLIWMETGRFSPPDGS